MQQPLMMQYVEHSVQGAQQPQYVQQPMEQGAQQPQYVEQPMMQYVEVPIEQWQEQPLHDAEYLMRHGYGVNIPDMLDLPDQMQGAQHGQHGQYEQQWAQIENAPGWYWRTSRNVHPGRIMYFNSETQQTQWEPPGRQRYNADDGQLYLGGRRCAQSLHVDCGNSSKLLKNGKKKTGRPPKKEDAITTKTAKSAPEPKSKPEPKPEPKPDPKPKSAPATKPKPNPKPKSAPATKPKPDPKPKSAPVTKPKSAPKPKPEPKPEPKTKPEPKPKSALATKQATVSPRSTSFKATKK